MFHPCESHRASAAFAEVREGPIAVRPLIRTYTLTTLNLHRHRVPKLFRRPQDRRRRVRVESLECRELLSTVFVTTAADSGDNNNPTSGSLRAAIIASNNAPVGTVTTIDFNIAAGGAQTISLLAPLPTLANPTIIDATTQPGYSGKPIIQVDGTQAGAGAIGFSLDDDSHNSTINGLEITGFNGGGILDDNGNSNTFNNDVIGLHVVTGLPASSAMAPSASKSEIRPITTLSPTSSSLATCTTVLSSTTRRATRSPPASSAPTLPEPPRSIAMARPLATASGQGRQWSGDNGTATNTMISNNVIVNNQSYGIYITDSGTTKNTVVTNKIGVAKTGTTALGNGLDGVAIVNGASSNIIGKAGQGNASRATAIAASGSAVSIIPARPA